MECYLTNIAARRAADALDWCAPREGVDYIIWMIPQDADICRMYSRILMAICKELGIPLVQEKQDGPTVVITLSGIIWGKPERAPHSVVVLSRSLFVRTRKFVSLGPPLYGGSFGVVERRAVM